MNQNLAPVDVEAFRAKSPHVGIGHQAVERIFALDTVLKSASKGVVVADLAADLVSGQLDGLKLKQSRHQLNRLVVDDSQLARH